MAIRDYYPTLLLSTLLGGGMSSRLFQEVREKRGLVYSIYSFSSPFMDGGLFGIYAGTGESEAEELMPVTLEELRKVQTEVTEAELARARAQVKASLLMSLESTGSRCEQLARQMQVFGRVVPTAETVAKINAVTTADVQPGRGAAVPRRADAGDDWARRAGADAGDDRGEAGGVKSVDGGLSLAKLVRMLVCPQSMSTLPRASCRVCSTRRWRVKRSLSRRQWEWPIRVRSTS